MTARVVLGATCYAEAHAALAVAVRVATRLGGEVQGLFVEEEAALAVAARPGARIVTPGGRLLTGVGAERMARAFLSDARRFERELGAAAGALSWSFARRAGQRAAVLAAALAAGDVLVLGGEAPRAPAGSVVYLAAPRPDPELEEVAADLAEALGLPLRVLMPPEPEAGLARLAGRPVERAASAEALSAALRMLRAGSILVGSIGDAPFGLDEPPGVLGLTRVLRASGGRD
ncbi:MAG: hypothetical protein OEM24_11645 [Paracoccaceae bacterium]|nr:hypothetical protein [Paracoccaceae bacterium]